MKSALALSFACLALLGCRALDVPLTPDELCARACVDRAAQCNAEACGRGCMLALDRLVEREGETVLACVVREKTCDDAVWAKCAAHVGAHADGGPPAPPPPKDIDDDEDDTPAKKPASDDL